MLVRDLLVHHEKKGERGGGNHGPYKFEYLKIAINDFDKIWLRINRSKNLNKMY